MDRVLLISFRCPSSPTAQAERSVILLQKPLIRKSAELTKLLEMAQWWLPTKSIKEIQLMFDFFISGLFSPNFDIYTH